LERFEWLLAKRLLRSPRSTRLSVVSGLSTAGIALGVAALIVVLAVNTGFQIAFQDRILALYPHLVVMRRGSDVEDWREVSARMIAVRGVRRAAAATYDDMMLASANGRAGAIVRGLESETLQAMAGGALVEGSAAGLDETPVVKVDGGVLIAGGGAASGRHVVVVTGGDVEIIPALAPSPGLGSLLTWSLGTTFEGARLARAGEGGIERSVRIGARGIGGLVEAPPGPHMLTLSRGGAPVESQAIVLAPGGRSTVLLEGSRVILVPAPPSEISVEVAAVAVVNLGDRPLEVRLPGAPAQAVATGETLAWTPFEAPLPGALLGTGLAERLGAKVGDELRAVSPLRGLERGSDGGGSDASTGRFRVAGLFRSGFHEHDQRLTLVGFGAAQRFLARGDVARWVEVRLDDPLLARARQGEIQAALDPVSMGDLLDDAGKLSGRLERIQAEPVAGLELRDATSARGFVDNATTALRALREVSGRRAGPEYRLIDWEEMNKNIFNVARMQKVAMSLFPFIIVLVAALNVVGTQAVVVHERAREIAILRAMGATRRSTGLVFLWQGAAVGLAGTLLGLVVGWLGCLALDRVDYPLDPKVYLISRLPVQLDWAPFAVAGVAAVLLSFGAAWIAAERAAARSPVDGLRRLD